MLKGLSVGAATWLLALVCGCGEVNLRAKPDRVSAGVAVRQTKGSYRGLKVNKTIPVWEVRASKTVTKDVDVYVKGQFNRGAVVAEHPILAGKADGCFEEGGVGVNYFPFGNRLLGLDLGTEAYYAKYKMQGQLGPFKQETPGRCWGGGVNAGLIGEIPLDEEGNCSIVWEAGHNFTATRSKQEANFSGWGGMIGFRYSWKP